MNIKSDKFRDLINKHVKPIYDIMHNYHRGLLEKNNWKKLSEERPELKKEVLVYKKDDSPYFEVVSMEQYPAGYDDKTNIQNYEYLWEDGDARQIYFEADIDLWYWKELEKPADDSVFRATFEEREKRIEMSETKNITPEPSDGVPRPHDGIAGFEVSVFAMFVGALWVAFTTFIVLMALR